MEKEGEAIPNNTKICFLSNYPPKECGLATFTKDITCAMNKKFNPKLRSRVIALNDAESHYQYDNRVVFQITRNNPQEYIETAQRINNSEEIKLVCIQHEFGLFGGDYGEDILYFLDAVEKPVVVTFHSVLPNPNEDRKRIVKQIAAKVSAIIVMAQAAIEILNKDYDIERSKMYLIHHGTPNAKFVSSEQYKKKLNMGDKTVILTFGLLSRGKGIEYMIKSLPPLIEKYPNLLYLILGETHPNIRMEEGESYRNELIELVKELGLENHVKFENIYVNLKELVEHILACDIYAFTNLEKEQITSGTLAYATSCGRPVISTPIIYAEELLAQDRGVVISEFKNPEAFTEALDKLLSNSELRSKMSEAAYAFGRQMIWPNVAARYLNVFNRVVNLREEITKKYPIIKLEHLKKMTDSLGCIQFSNGSIPDKNSGYTLDDNARALIAAVLHNNLFKSSISLSLARKYLSFIEKTQRENGTFINTFKKKNQELGDYSDDAMGRAMWSLGYAVEKSKNKLIANKAEDLFDKSFPMIKTLESPRAKAFLIIGLYHHYQRFGRKRDLEMINTLADSLCKLYEEHSSNKWKWFEPQLNYSNAKMCEALFLSYLETKNEKHLKVAKSTLHFLSDIVFIEDELHPIGQNGWFDKNGKRALFDQQPVDVASMVSACLAAYLATEDKHYREKAVLAFNWFLGKNHLKQMIYNEDTGGCYDGLGERSVNLNQGAESTISYLLARLNLEEVKKNF